MKDVSFYIFSLPFISYAIMFFIASIVISIVLVLIINLLACTPSREATSDEKVFGQAKSSQAEEPEIKTEDENESVAGTSASGKEGTEVNFSDENLEAVSIG